MECYDLDCWIWVSVVAAIDIDSNLLRTAVDVNYVMVPVHGQWFVGSRAVVDLKSKFLSVYCWRSTKNSTVVIVHVVGAVVAVVAEVAVMDFGNSTLYRYCKQTVVASCPAHLCSHYGRSISSKTFSVATWIVRRIHAVDWIDSID